MTKEKQPEKLKRNERVSYQYSWIPIAIGLLMRAFVDEENVNTAIRIILIATFVIARLAGVGHRASKKK